MKKMKLRYKILIAIGFVIFVLLFLLSTFIKKWAENNSQDFIGRKISLDELHINYLKVAVNAKDFVLYETNKTDTFVSFTQLYVNFQPWALLHKEYAFAEISLIDPHIFVCQNGTEFNFSDLIPKDTTQTTKHDTTYIPLQDTSRLTIQDTSQTIVRDTAQNSSLRFTLKNIEIKDGLIVYEDREIDNQFTLKDFNLHVPVIAWDNRQTDLGVNFRMGEKGEVNIKANVNNQQNKYAITLNTKHISLEPVKNYLNDYLDLNYFNGLLSTEIQVKGDLDQVMHFNASGSITLDSLLLNDNQNNHLFSINHFETKISNIDMLESDYHISSVKILNPKITASLNKDMSNFERVMQPYFIKDTLVANKDSIAQVEEPVTDSKTLSYRVDTIELQNGEIDFTDNTLNRPFQYKLNDLRIQLTELTDSAMRVPVNFFVNTNNDGEISGKVFLDMTNTKNLDLDMKIHQLGLINFSPYAEYYIASPIVRGAFNYNMSIDMTSNKLVNQNNIRLEELEFGKKTKDSTAVKVPIKLALYILKDPKGMIAFDLPVTGNPSDPQFSYGKILWKALANFLVKTAAAPFNAMAGLTTGNAGDMDEILFDYGQNNLQESQKEKLTKLAEVIHKKPELLYKFIQFTDKSKEKEKIAIELAKKEYVQQSLENDTDSVAMNNAVNEINLNNEAFIAFVYERAAQIDSLNFGKTCTTLFAEPELEQQFNLLVVNRNQELKKYLINTHEMDAEIIEISTADFGNIPSELKYPHFKVDVDVQ